MKGNEPEVVYDFGYIRPAERLAVSHEGLSSM
jgi:hypothetical protein